MKTVVALDTSQYALTALDKAIELSSRFGGSLYAISVVPGLGVVDELSDRLVDKMVAEATKVVDEAKKKAGAEGVEIEVRVVQGATPADAILGFATEIGADMVVVGHRGTTNLERFLVGSVARNLVMHAPCSVLVVK